MNDKEILNIFKITSPITDEVIENNFDPLFDLEGDVFLIIPSYMAWCLRKNHSDGNLIIDGTISALSQLGRAKYTLEGNSRFKYVCNKDQIEAILNFLHIYLQNELLQVYTQRAIKQWQKPINKN